MGLERDLLDLTLISIKVKHCPAWLFHWLVLPSHESALYPLNTTFSLLCLTCLVQLLKMPYYIVKGTQEEKLYWWFRVMISNLKCPLNIESTCFFFFFFKVLEWDQLGRFLAFKDLKGILNRGEEWNVNWVSYFCTLAGWAVPRWEALQGEQHGQFRGWMCYVIIAKWLECQCFTVV